MFSCTLKILQLKQKLKAYEEKNMVPGACNTVSSKKQEESKRYECTSESPYRQFWAVTV